MQRLRTTGLRHQEPISPGAAGCFGIGVVAAVDAHEHQRAVSRDRRDRGRERRPRLGLVGRRHRILDLLHEDPTRPWRPRDVAARFGDISLETMYRQLNRWAANGLIHKIGPGLYTATKWAPTPLPPAEIP